MGVGFLERLQSVDASTRPQCETCDRAISKFARRSIRRRDLALLVEKPDVIHSSFWGGDLEAFILQGKARGVFEGRTVVLTAGETAMFRLATQIPNGTVIGARGPHGVFAPDHALNKWFHAAYLERYGTPPVYPSYKMVQAILGLKAAMEKAAAGKPDKPATDAVVVAFEGLSYEAPSGRVDMKLGKGHQAI